MVPWRTEGHRRREHFKDRASRSSWRCNIAQAPEPIARCRSAGTARKQPYQTICPHSSIAQRTQRRVRTFVILARPGTDTLRSSQQKIGFPAAHIQFTRRRLACSDRVLQDFRAPHDLDGMLFGDHPFIGAREVLQAQDT